MELTKRQEKQLSKVFENPKKLRKWLDGVFNDMVKECEEKTMDTIEEYLNIYSITVAYTLHYACGFGKKRLPEIMERIWNNLDCFKTKHLDLQDCIDELTQYGVEFDNIIHHESKANNTRS